MSGDYSTHSSDIKYASELQLISCSKTITTSLPIKLMTPDANSLSTIHKHTSNSNNIIWYEISSVTRTDVKEIEYSFEELNSLNSESRNFSIS